MEIRALRRGDEPAVRRVFEEGIVLDSSWEYIKLAWRSLLPRAAGIALALATTAISALWPRSDGPNAPTSAEWLLRSAALAAPIASAYYVIVYVAARRLAAVYASGSLAGDMGDISGHYQNSPGKGFWVSVADGEVAGCVGLDTWTADSDARGTVGELRRLSVSRRHRGRRIGAQLVRHLLSEARRAGYVEVRLTTVFAAVKGRRLYEKLGFRLMREPVTMLRAYGKIGILGALFRMLVDERLFWLYQYGFQLDD